MRTVILPLAALAALSACSTTWSVEAPTEEQRAVARYICLGDEGALADYLAERGQVVSDVAVPLGPERELYCALRGNRIASEP